MANDFKQEKYKVRKNILKNTEPFVHSCYTGWLFYEFLKILRKTSQYLRPASLKTIDSITLFYLRNFLKIQSIDRVPWSISCQNKDYCNTVSSVKCPQSIVIILNRFSDFYPVSTKLDCYRRCTVNTVIRLLKSFNFCPRLVLE